MSFPVEPIVPPTIFEKHYSISYSTPACICEFNKLNITWLINLIQGQNLTLIGTFFFLDPKVQTPNHFLLNVMLTAPLPLWTTAYVRGKNHRYFT